jgi:hypothetical protein
VSKNAFTGRARRDFDGRAVRALAHYLIGVIERKRLSAVENPHAPFFLQGRIRVHGPQGNALAFGFKGKAVARFKTQLVADLLRNDNPAGLVDGYGRIHDTIVGWHYTIIKW